MVIAVQRLSKIMKPLNLPFDRSFLSVENHCFLELREALERETVLQHGKFWLFLKPCTVKLLLVTDGGLDFSDAYGFGLAAFVRTLLDMPGRHVRFEITLAHIDVAAANQMMDTKPRIANRITRFRFDKPAHFGSSKYDVVFLFGIKTSFSGRSNDANVAPSPTDRLSDTELRAVTEVMNDGGGLFATGDHGALGRALCHAIPRVRNMRLWQSTSAEVADDEVSMAGPRRDDTNRLGDVGSQFDDQSDDVPQDIQQKLYSRWQGLFRYSFPHPLLCGPAGAIRVMPDHPHEGECIEPPVTDLDLDFGGPLGKEYSVVGGAGSQPLPEIISVSGVLSGTTSSGKAPTTPQSFWGICAYDGHRAGIGRVVTDATWHHVVNVNLIGDSGALMGSPRRLGFLLSPAGQADFEQVKTHFRNLAVWRARPESISCMNSRLIYGLVWNERVMEAVLSKTEICLKDTRTHVFSSIGQHARDVLGRHVGACQTVMLVLDLVIRPTVPELVADIDPWIDGDQDSDDGTGWFDRDAAARHRTGRRSRRAARAAARAGRGIRLWPRHAAAARGDGERWRRGTCRGDHLAPRVLGGCSGPVFVSGLGQGRLTGHGRSHGTRPDRVMSPSLPAWGKSHEPPQGSGPARCEPGQGTGSAGCQ